MPLPTVFNTNYPLGIKITAISSILRPLFCILFHITAMKRIWRFFDGLTTIKETFIFQGALLEFHINCHEADLDLPRLSQRIKDSDKLC